MKNLFYMLVLVLASGAADAADLFVTVTGVRGDAVEHAVVALAPRFETQRLSDGLPASEMKQEGTLFSPFVLPVPVGTEVSFPNMDEFRHQVYSFAQAKPFELRLYGQDESKSVIFDKPGVVAVGCNIHDNMLAFIYVSEHQILRTTDRNGGAMLTGLEAGDYDVFLWHPDIKGAKATQLPAISVSETAENNLPATIDLRSSRQAQQPPAEDNY